jgi:hypothetical protein
MSVEDKQLQFVYGFTSEEDFKAVSEIHSERIMKDFVQTLREID